MPAASARSAIHGESAFVIISRGAVRLRGLEMKMWCLPETFVSILLMQFFFFFFFFYIIIYAK